MYCLLCMSSDLMTDCKQWSKWMILFSWGACLQRMEYVMLIFLEELAENQWSFAFSCEQPDYIQNG